MDRKTAAAPGSVRAGCADGFFSAGIRAKLEQQRRFRIDQLQDLAVTVADAVATADEPSVLGDRRVAQPVRGQQHDPRSLGQPRPNRPGPGQPGQLLAVRSVSDNTISTARGPGCDERWGWPPACQAPNHTVATPGHLRVKGELSASTGIHWGVDGPPLWVSV